MEKFTELEVSFQYQLLTLMQENDRLFILDNESFRYIYFEHGMYKCEKYLDNNSPVCSSPSNLWKTTVKSTKYSQKMFKAVVLTTMLFCFATSLSPCEPYGLRVYYGDIVINPYSTERFVIYFNTQQACSNSFVNTISKDGFRKKICNTKVITTTAFANFYTTYIHVCSFS